MKKILVLGMNGMLGNALYKYLKDNRSFEVLGTVRKTNLENCINFDIDADFRDKINSLISNVNPNYILNCIGYIRPKDTAEDLSNALLINSVFPQVLSSICVQNKIRLIQFSTDCVFTGKKGNYKDTDIPDETSVYGISKFLGEVRELPNITIRTSIIGRELKNSKNLLDWFLHTTDKEVHGYKNVMWNGITTLTMANIVERIIEKDLTFNKPIIQLTSNKLSKLDLLYMFRTIYHKKIDIIEDTDTISDKTLIASSEQDKYFGDIIIPIDKQLLKLKSFYSPDAK